MTTVFNLFKGLNTYMLSPLERKELKKINDFSIIYKFFEIVFYSETRPLIDKITFLSIYGLVSGSFIAIFMAIFINFIIPIIEIIIRYFAIAMFILETLI